MNDTACDESNRTWIPIRREGLCCRAFDGEAVLYDPAHHAVHYLNRTACLIWNCCDGRHEVEDIVLEVTAAFEPSTPQDNPVAAVRADVRSTLSTLTENGLIESSP